MIYGYLYIPKTDIWISRFMWVRAQIDYLQRLPSDIEKQRALKKLPPDLPRTYIRIFETIDSVFPVQTTKYVQRLLKWLVLGLGGRMIRFGTTWGVPLTPEILLQAICIENEAEWPSDAAMPRTEQILGWLGCLVRKTSNRITLSHFTVKEFLKTNAEDVPSCAARKYLVNHKDEIYVLDVCLTCITHNEFKDTALTTWGKVQEFLEKYPTFGFVVVRLCGYIGASIRSAIDRESENLILSPSNAWDGSQGPTSIRQTQYVTPGDRMQRLLSMSHRRPLELWAICHAYPDLNYNQVDLIAERHQATQGLTSPLQFAAATGLMVEVQRLLELDLDPDDVGSLGEAESCPTPLHLAICGNHELGYCQDPVSANLCINITNPYVDKDQVILERSLLVIKILLESGADIDRQLKLFTDDICDNSGDMTVIVTPLVLAVICDFPEAASVLLNAGAKWEVVANENVQDVVALCSLERLLLTIPRYESTIQDVIDVGGHQTLKDALENWKAERERGDRDSSRTYKNGNDDLSSQELFVETYQMGSWGMARELIATRLEIEINRNDASGLNAVYCASAAEVKSRALAFLLENGAEPNLLTSAGDSALKRTVKEDCLDKMSLLLQSGADIEHSGPSGWTSLLLAVYHGHREVLELLLDEGANLNAVLNDGAGVLQLAIERGQTDTFSLLLARGADPTLSNNHGSNPLHEACRCGLEFAVGKTLETASKPAELANCESVEMRTPLYIAAAYGFGRILTRLLDNGAEVDKAGPGNLFGSALLAACAYGHEDVVKLVLSRGASQVVEGSRFKSAVRTARAFRWEAIVKILEGPTTTEVEEVK